MPWVIDTTRLNDFDSPRATTGVPSFEVEFEFDPKIVELARNQRAAELKSIAQSFWKFLTEMLTIVQKTQKTHDFPEMVTETVKQKKI